MSRLTVVVGDVDAFALELVEPFLVGFIARMLAYIVLLRTITEADAIFDDCAAIVSC